MTTVAATALYEAQHNFQYEGYRNAVFNPHEKSLDNLPIIYGFNNGGRPGWVDAVLLAQDGTCLGSHLCSSEAYMPADLGILQNTRPDRHEDFRKHYPDGYKMAFVRGCDVLQHDGLNQAVKLVREKQNDNI